MWKKKVKAPHVRDGVWVINFKNGEIKPQMEKNEWKSSLMQQVSAEIGLSLSDERKKI